MISWSERYDAPLLERQTPSGAQLGVWVWPDPAARGEFFPLVPAALGRHAHVLAHTNDGAVYQSAAEDPSDPDRWTIVGFGSTRAHPWLDEHRHKRSPAFSKDRRWAAFVVPDRRFGELRGDVYVAALTKARATPLLQATHEPHTRTTYALPAFAPCAR